MLFVDRVKDIQPELNQDEELPLGTTITAELDIHSELEVFRYHYPEKPILPGNLITEAIEQTAALLVLSHRKDEGKLYPILQGVDSQKIITPVVPNINRPYKLTLKATLVSVKDHREYVFNGQALLPNSAVSVEITGIKARVLAEKTMRRLLRLANSTH